MPSLKDRVIVAADPLFVDLVPTGAFRVIQYVDAGVTNLVDLFIAVAASSLTEYANEIGHALESKQFRIMFLREDMALDWLPEQLLKAKFPLKSLPKVLVYSDWKVAERVINAWVKDSQESLIFNAFAAKDALVIRNCALETLEVPFDSPVLRDIPVAERGEFEIDEAGSFIHWPSVDIDLDFDSLRYLVDPALRKKADAQRVIAEQGFGYAVKGIRELNNLTQTDIESRVGISERQLRRYETEGIKPRVSNLEKLARAHHMDLNAYLEKLAVAVNGPAVVVIACDTAVRQAEIAKWLTVNFSLLARENGRPRPLYRRKGSRDHDIWSYDQRPHADESKEQLGLAVRVESVEDFEALWSFCTENQLEPDVAIGLDQWPSIGFVPATKDYVENKLRQRRF